MNLARRKAGFLLPKTLRSALPETLRSALPETLQGLPT